MEQLDIYLEAQGPVLIGKGLARGNVQTSREYVPGSVWRGTIAGIILDGLGLRKHNGRPIANEAHDPAFRRIFLGDASPAARFGFLYPVRERLEQVGRRNTLLIPLTARTCKLNPGFKPKGHGVYDGVMNRLREAAANEQLYRRGLSKCPVCGQRIVRLRGFAARYDKQYERMSVGTRSFVRVGLNRYTETAQKGVLYVLDALVPDPDPLTFVGTWYGSEHQGHDLRLLLHKYLLPAPEGGYSFRIGTARARGMGEVRLRFATRAAMTSLEQRFEQFQPLKNGKRLDSEHLYAVLTFRSPLQLLDEHGIPTTYITRDTLEAYDSDVPQGLKVLHDYSIVEQEVWTGWSAAWGLPKVVAPALAAGGVLIVRAPKDERVKLLSWLSTIEGEGLGERRAEGWGEILVCDRFHLDHDEESEV
jgi:CRISPR-associated protein Csx10